MRILHLLAPAPAGGLERVVQGLAIGQRQRGHDVRVVPVVEQWRDDLPFAVPLARAGVTIIPIAVGGRDYRGERRLLREILSASTPEIVHSHGYHTNVVDRRLVMDAGVPFVATAHGFTRGSLKNRVYEWLDCRALARADAAIAVAHPLAEELARRGVSRDRLYTVPNGWVQSATPLARHEARAALGLPTEATVIGWVGRMTHEKGLDIFVEGLAHVPPAVVACIVGAGVERESAERRAAALGLSDRIVWAGLVKEAGRYFNAFDALCQSSRTEGVPMVILESMAMGIPIVATAVGGVPDVLSNAEASLVASEDPGALGRAITRTLTDVVHTRDRARAAYDRLARQFSGDAWLDEHERIYRTAMTRRHRRGR
jgi:glycosyltransferase involved in cell wall biosynthesis